MKKIILFLPVLALIGCGPRYAEKRYFSATVVGQRFEPSELGSGDKYYMDVESCVDPGVSENVYRICLPNDPAPRVIKTIVYQWPDSTRMLETQSFPQKGQHYRFFVHNYFVALSESVMYSGPWVYPEQIP